MTKSAVVLGGGIAGMSAAHELSERGFEVHVYEQRDVPGGKARSVVVPSTLPRPNIGTVHRGRLAAATRRDLPGEHGFRFFPRFYKHIIDVMERTPYRGSRSVAENLVDTTGTTFARFNRPASTLPTRVPRTLPEMFALAHDLGAIFGPEFGIPADDLGFFGQRIWQILTSCSERRMSEYEKTGWWEFIGAEDRSDNYQKLFGTGCTRSVVAAQAKRASTKTIGDMFVQYFFNLSNPSVSADRVLNGPTNDVWLDPWLEFLQSRGVRYHLDTRVRSIHCANGVVQRIMVERDRRVTEVRGDYYIAALPIEVMATLVTDEVTTADPRLVSLFPLSRNTAWMNGIQFYLTHDVPIGRGHQIYLDSPWALTSISQKQFWRNVDLSRYADGTIRGVLSVDISDWDTPGLNGKAARQCTRDEIRDEVWEQLKRGLNVEGAELLEDDDLRYWYLDLDVDPLLKSDAEPLLVNLVDTWRLRPGAVTAIPNLFLAADYVQTYTDLATMEGANEAARRAVNGILERSGVDAPRCQIWNLHEPELLRPWRNHDLTRFRQGLPWDDRVIRLAVSALTTLYRGAAVVEASVREAVGLATNAEDVLSYVRTGESRSALLSRLTSPEAGESGELLRAFGEFARAAGAQPADALSSSALQVLTAAGGELEKGVHFVSPGS